MVLRCLFLCLAWLVAGQLVASAPADDIDPEIRALVNKELLTRGYGPMAPEPAGKGLTAHVCMAANEAGKVAVKVQRKNRPENTPLLEREIALLRGFDNHYIVTYCFDFSVQALQVVAWRWCEQTLYDYCVTEGLENKDYRTILHGLAQGLNYLHNEKRIVHRDLKPDNILVEGRLDGLKIADFGFSETIGFQPEKPSGSLAYMAMEVFTGAPLNPKSDMWALGMLLFFILDGDGFPIEFDKVPEGQSRDQTVEQMVNALEDLEGKRIAWSSYIENLNPKLAYVLSCLLVIGVDGRWGARELLNYLDMFMKGT